MRILCHLLIPTSFTQWADLPITAAEYTAKQIELQEKYFPSCAALPGVPKLLKDLSKAAVAGDGERRVHIALATSSHKRQFKMKTNHLSELFEVFREERRVLGDDPRIGKGRGKPAPDIWLVALKAINEGLGEGEREVKPEECLGEFLYWMFEPLGYVGHRNSLPEKSGKWNWASRECADDSGSIRRQRAGSGVRKESRHAMCVGSTSRLV